MRIGFSSHTLKPPGLSMRLALGLNPKWDGGREKFPISTPIWPAVAYGANLVDRCFALRHASNALRSTNLALCTTVPTRTNLY